MSAAFRFESWPDDLLCLVFDTPGKSANLLSREAIADLAARLDELASRPAPRALVVASAKPGVFIAGADIREFAASYDVPRAELLAYSARGREVFARLSSFSFPSVALIDGICVGGGAELALACDLLVMTDGPRAQFGLPEVKLGLIPGWGGTALLPRRVGLANAVELVTGGEPIDAGAAVRMGLARGPAPAGQPQAYVAALVRELLAAGTLTSDRTRRAGPLAVDPTELAFLGATAAAVIQQQTKGRYPAPSAALELMLGSAELDAAAAMKAESQAFAELFGTPVNRGLVNVFFLNDRNKKDAGPAGAAVGERRGPPRVGIVGAGIMGSGIAAAVLRREFPVTLFDANPAALGAGASRALSEAAFDKAAGGATTARTLQLAPRLLAAPGLDALAGCDVVIEAIVENEEAKRALYRELEPRLGPTAILATNTSAISVARLAEGLARPERFLGIHFFNPVRKMPLVEVVRGPRTGDEAVAAAVALAKAAGKSPIVVQDGPGFLVNRVLFPYMNEAVQLLAEGVAPEAIDAAAKAFGMPMGPITLFDVVGLDTALFAGRVMHAAWPERMHESPLLAQLVAAGRLGQKSRAGFFAYDGKSDRGKPDPALGPFLAAVRQAGPTPGREQLVDRLMLPMLAEAVRALEDGVVRDARDVDLGLILGIGFPPFLGGLLFWADQCGLAKLVDRLRALEPLGPRYAPPRRLVELAAAGGTFYGT